MLPQTCSITPNAEESFHPLPCSIHATPRKKYISCLSFCSALQRTLVGSTSWLLSETHLTHNRLRPTHKSWCFIQSPTAQCNIEVLGDVSVSQQQNHRGFPQCEKERSFELTCVSVIKRNFKRLDQFRAVIFREPNAKRGNYF